MQKLWIVKCQYIRCNAQTRLRINSCDAPSYIFIIRNSVLNRIHVMSGKVETSTTANDVVYEKNLLYAIEKCQKEDIVVVIEPINPYSVPNYYMNNFQKGMELNLYCLTCYEFVIMGIIDIGIISLLLSQV